MVRRSKRDELPPWPFVDAQAKKKDPCKKEKEKEQKACKDYKPNPGAKKDACIEAGLADKLIQSDKDAKKRGIRQCGELVVFQGQEGKCRTSASRLGASPSLLDTKPDKERREKCCRSQTPDHLIPKSLLSLKSPLNMARN